MFFKLSVSLHSTDTNSSNFWITSSLIWDTFTHLVFVYKWKNTTFFNKTRKQTSNRDFLKIKTLGTIILATLFSIQRQLFWPRFISRKISVPFSPVLFKSWQANIFSDVIRRNASCFYHEENLSYKSLWLVEFDYVTLF